MNLVNYACERLLQAQLVSNAHAMMILFFHIYTNVKKHLLKRKYIVIVRQGTVHSSSGTASEGQHHHKDEGEKSEQDGEEVEEEAEISDLVIFFRYPA